jgi:hypothetical protein
MTTTLAPTSAELAPNSDPRALVQRLTQFAVLVAVAIGCCALGSRALQARVDPADCARYDSCTVAALVEWGMPV